MLRDFGGLVIGGPREACASAPQARPFTAPAKRSVGVRGKRAAWPWWSRPRQAPRWGGPRQGSSQTLSPLQSPGAAGGSQGHALWRRPGAGAGCTDGPPGGAPGELGEGPAGLVWTARMHREGPSQRRGWVWNWGRQRGRGGAMCGGARAHALIAQEMGAGACGQHASQRRDSHRRRFSSPWGCWGVVRRRGRGRGSGEESEGRRASRGG